MNISTFSLYFFERQLFPKWYFLYGHTLSTGPKTKHPFWENGKPDVIVAYGGVWIPTLNKDELGVASMITDVRFPFGLCSSLFLKNISSYSGHWSIRLFVKKMRSLWLIEGLENGMIITKVWTYAEKERKKKHNRHTYQSSLSIKWNTMPPLPFRSASWKQWEKCPSE